MNPTLPSASWVDLIHAQSIPLSLLRRLVRSVGLTTQSTAAELGLFRKAAQEASRLKKLVFATSDAVTAILA